MKVWEKINQQKCWNVSKGALAEFLFSNKICPLSIDSELEMGLSDKNPFNALANDLCKERSKNSNECCPCGIKCINDYLEMECK